MTALTRRDATFGAALLVCVLFSFGLQVVSLALWCCAGAFVVCLAKRFLLIRRKKSVPAVCTHCCVHPVGSTTTHIQLIGCARLSGADFDEMKTCQLLGLHHSAILIVRLHEKVSKG